MSRSKRKAPSVVSRVELEKYALFLRLKLNLNQRLNFSVGQMRGREAAVQSLQSTKGYLCIQTVSS